MFAYLLSFFFSKVSQNQYLLKEFETESHEVIKPVLLSHPFNVEGGIIS